MKSIKALFSFKSKKNSKPTTASTPTTKTATKTTTTPVVTAAATATVVADTAAPTHPINTHTTHTFAALAKSDSQLAPLANSPYTKPVSADRIARTKTSLESKGYKVTLVNNKSEAFETLKSLIPKGSSVNNAHSTSLEEIGFITFLKSEESSSLWNNVHKQILEESDYAKQGELRRTIGLSVDYYLTSMAAVTEDGLLAHGDLSGSKVGGVAFGAANVIVVVGANKIVKDEEEALKRTTEFALPAESARARDAYGVPASALSHYEVIRGANPFNKDRMQILLVNEALGF